MSSEGRCHIVDWPIEDDASRVGADSGSFRKLTQSRDERTLKHLQLIVYMYSTRKVTDSRDSTTALHLVHGLATTSVTHGLGTSLQQ